MKKHAYIINLLRYLFMIALGIILLFPLVIMFFSSFKSNSEMFGTLKILPREFLTDGYRIGWNGMGAGSISFGKYLFLSLIHI